MSSLKSAVLCSLFSGVSFTDLQRAARHNEGGQTPAYPSAADVAYASRFSAAAQATGPEVAVSESFEDVPLSALVPDRDAA